MKQNYSFALQEVLKSEGGYTNDPRDPGGATNFGITIADYRMYINSRGTLQDVRRMTVDQAKTIYQSKYWEKVDADSLPSGVDYCVFDYGVNSGVSRANRVYRQLVQEHSDPKDLINAICDERIHFLQSLHSWSVFGKGWANRVASVRALSLNLARTPVEIPPDISNINDKVNQYTSLWTTVKSFLSDNLGSLFRHVSVTSVAGTGIASISLSRDWPWILAGSVGLAILVWIVLKLYEGKNNGNS